MFRRNWRHFIGLPYFGGFYLAEAAINSQGGFPADPVRIALALSLLGAVLGFLPFNFNPASIFMGDTGSMFLGFICGTMILLFGQHGTLPYFLSAIIMFGLPMMDTLLAIVRRKLNGKPIFSPDSDHFHHFLIKRGLSVRRAVFISYGVAALFVSFGLIIVIIPTPLAVGVYLVLFGWIIVAAFKMGMVFQHTANVASNTSLNLAVITLNGGSPTVPASAAIFSEAEKPQEVTLPNVGQVQVGRQLFPQYGKIHRFCPRPRSWGIHKKEHSFGPGLDRQAERKNPRITQCTAIC